MKWRKNYFSEGIYSYKNCICYKFVTAVVKKKKIIQWINAENVAVSLNSNILSKFGLILNNWICLTGVATKLLQCLILEKPELRKYAVANGNRALNNHIW